LDCKFYTFSQADDWLTANNFKLVIDTYNNFEDQASGRYKTYLNTTYYIFLTISEDVNNIDQIDFMEYFFRWKLFSNLIPFVDNDTLVRLRAFSPGKVINLSQILNFNSRVFQDWRSNRVFHSFVEKIAFLKTIGEFKNWSGHDKFPNLLTRNDQIYISRRKIIQISKDRLNEIILRLKLNPEDYKLNIEE
jgi:hypothetical protein